jgi:uncharacterized membrane protein YuzA (DUF378 family)
MPTNLVASAPSDDLETLCACTLKQERTHMKAINIITLVLALIGGINWGFVGLFDFNLVAVLLGGQRVLLAQITYVLVGLSAVWQLCLLALALRAGEIRAQRYWA